MKYIILILFCTIQLMSSQEFDSLSNSINNHISNENYSLAKLELEKYINLNSGKFENDSLNIQYLRLSSTVEFYSKNYNNSDSLINEAIHLYKIRYQTYTPYFLELLSISNAVTLAKGNDKKFVEDFSLYMKYVDTVYKLYELKDVAEHLHYYVKVFENLYCFEFFNISMMINELDFLYHTMFKEFEQRGYSQTWSYGFLLLNYSTFLANLGLVDEQKNAILKAIDITSLPKYEKLDLAYTPNNNLSALEASIGNYTKSLDYAEIAYKIIENSSNLDEHGNILSKFGLNYYKLGKYELAEDYFKLVEKKLDTIYERHQQSEYYRNHEGYMAYHYHLKATNLAHWGNLLFDLDKIDEAKEKFQRSIDLIKNIDDYNHIFRLKNYYLKLAYLNYQSKDINVADSLFDKMLKINRSFIKNLIYNLPEYMKEKFIPKIKGDFDIYNNYLIQEIINNSNLTKLLETRINNKGILFYSSKKLKEKLSKNTSKEVASLVSIQNEINSKISGLLIGRINSSSSYSKELDSLYEINKQVDKSLARLLRLQNDDNLNQIESWTQVQNVLRSDEAAIEIIRIPIYKKIKNKFNPNIQTYDFSDSVVYVAIIIRKDKSNPDFVILENSNKLDSASLTIYESAISPDRKDLLKKSFKDIENINNKKLNISYRNYFQQIDQKLNNIKKIYISNDGIYNKLNLELLIDDKQNYLFDKYDIINVSSTKDLLSERIDNGDNNNIALFGGVNYDSKMENDNGNNSLKDISQSRAISTLKNEFKYLPYTLKEVESINGIFNQLNWKTILYIKDNATKSNLKKINSPTILHIASHAYFKQDKDDKLTNQNDPILEQYTKNGIILAGANSTIKQIKNNNILNNEDNGILTSLEALNLNLDNTNLVVLSACETGKGYVQNGEGVYGLQRAFQLAGAKQILLTLWKVDDEATQILLTEFYKHYTKSWDAKSSLKFAQNKLKKNPRYSKPKHWGGFVLYGKE